MFKSTTRKMYTFAFLLWSLLMLCHAEVSVTIYNKNLAMVHDSREYEFPKGIGEVRFTDVATKIIPGSVHFSSDNAVLLEQNYEYDLVSSQKLFSRYVDQEVKLHLMDNEFLIGRLLSAEDGVVIEEDNGSIRSISRSNIQSAQFPKLPDGLITRPTLVWLTQSQNGGKGIGEASYQTRGINWETEYVVVLSEDEKSLDMTGWVNITNNSGATYKDAKLKLMAGDVNVASSRSKARDRGSIEISMLLMKAPKQFEEKSFYEYHLYTLQRRSTIADNQVKQIALFPSAEVKNVKKIYRYESYFQKHRVDSKVSVTLSYANDKSNNLEVPLPKGLIRVYKADTDGSLEFIGEHRIDHTPRNEEIRIPTGNAFDVVGERKRTDKRGQLYSFEIRIRNHKDEDIEVVVGEGLRGNWEIKEANPANWKKINSNLIEWKLKIKSNEERVINYKVNFTVDK